MNRYQKLLRKMTGTTITPASWMKGVGSPRWYYSEHVQVEAGCWARWSVSQVGGMPGDRNRHWIVARTLTIRNVRCPHRVWLDRDGSLHDFVVDRAYIEPPGADVWKTAAEARWVAERKEAGEVTLAGWREARFGKKGSAAVDSELLWKMSRYKIRTWARYGTIQRRWYSVGNFKLAERVVAEWQISRHDLGWVAKRRLIHMGCPLPDFVWLDRDGTLRYFTADAKAGVWKTAAEAKRAAERKELGEVILTGWREARFDRRP